MMEGVLDVRATELEVLYNQGLELPYVEFAQVEPAIKLVHEGEEYWYYKTLPLKGYGAVLGRYARQLMQEERKLLLARFASGDNFSTSSHWDRIYIYATGIRPIGAGKPPGA
ncbi:MAG: hypothetical protein ACE5KW_03345 [Dehalococcoidia bacterium]